MKYNFFFNPKVNKSLRNKNQPDALSFLIYFNNYPLHVSNRFYVDRVSS